MLGLRLCTRAPIYSLTIAVANAVQADGFTYERSAIEQWLMTHDTSPTTGVELESKQLIQCHSLRSLIRDFYERRQAPSH